MKVGEEDRYVPLTCEEVFDNIRLMFEVQMFLKIQLPFFPTVLREQSLSL